MKTCIHCPHPEAAHKAGGCRIGRCACPGFDDGSPRPPVPGFRRVAIDVPDGYALHVELVPLPAGETAAQQIREASDGDEYNAG